MADAFVGLLAWFSSIWLASTFHPSYENIVSNPFVSSRRLGVSEASATCVRAEGFLQNDATHAGRCQGDDSRAVVKQGVGHASRPACHAAKEPRHVLHVALREKQLAKASGGVGIIRWCRLALSQGPGRLCGAPRLGL
eukprot:scaffold83352_cov63-Phaeocystis_antarctica.AAC.2